MSPSACPACRRRLALLGLLAPFIENVSTREPGSRSPELLALDDGDLATAVAGAKAGGVLSEAGKRSEETQRNADAAGAWTLCRHDERFPAGLLAARDGPAALVGLGDPGYLARLDPDRTVTVVGARRATSYGRGIAGSLARELARSGFAVVSGMAWGIDAAAHRGALGDGLTVAVLGCGADVPYPRHHSGLHAQISEHGLVLSELPPGTGAWRWAFPARNRIMAGLAAMTVVVEAASRSGSLITADLAMDLGREVGAVPGPVGARMSAGANQLLADGAQVVRDGQDVLDALIGPGAPREAVPGPQLDADLAAVLDRVEQGDADPDAIAVALGQGGRETSIALVRLELLGYIDASLSGVYSRTALTRPGAAT